MNLNEEVKEENTAATLADSQECDNKTNEENVPELNSSTAPTEEQVKEANISDEHGEGHTDENVNDVPPAMTDEQQAVEKMLSQSQVDEIVGRTRVDAREKALKGIYDKYEVADENGLDALFAKSQGYDTLKDETDSIIGQMKDELSEVKSKIAMYESNIAPERYEDVKLILKGKGLDINAENILKEIETHPEWKKAEIVQNEVGEEPVAEGNFVRKQEMQQPVNPIEVLGNERPESQSGPTERELAMKMFDL